MTEVNGNPAPEPLQEAAPAQQPVTEPAPSVKPICGAHKRLGGICQSTVLYPNGRCRLHGGGSLAGIASPTYKHGRRSKYFKQLPPKMRKALKDVASDEELLSLRDELELLTGRLMDRLEALQQVPEPPYGAALRALDLLEKRYTEGEALSDSLTQLRAVLVSGRKAEVMQRTLWEEIRTLIQEKKSVAAVEWKRLVDMQAVLTVEDATMFLRALLAAAKETVKDQAALQALQARTIELLPGGKRGE